MTVSIVMAAKNYARFLPQAVRSVFAQTYADWELVVIDDGSTDDTPSAVRPFLADARVTYVRSDVLGQSRAKNLGVRLSRGAFVAFLDADDAWLPTKLEKQVALFAANPELGVAFSKRWLIDEAGNRLPTPIANPPRGRVADAIFVRNFVCFSSAVVRRELFDRVGGFDPMRDLSIDYDLWLRAAPHYDFDFVDEELVLYRTGHGNLSQKLSDRIATAYGIMNAACRRGGFGRSAVAEGYASTAASMAWLLRGAEPWRSLRWYLRALAHPSCRGQTLRGAFGVFKRRGELSPENRPENV